MSSQLSEFAPKGLQFIKEIIPIAAKLAILGDPSNPGTDATISAVEAGALTLGFKTAFLPAWPGRVATSPACR